jgi:hypothetical protein
MRVTTKKGTDMGSKVTLIVEIDRRGKRLVVEKKMDIWIVEDAIRDIDLPDGTADGFSRYLCSDVATIEATMKARHEIAKSLTTAILDALGAGDKRMGYPQASNVRANRPAAPADGPG